MKQENLELKEKLSYSELAVEKLLKESIELKNKLKESTAPKKVRINIAGNKSKLYNHEKLLDSAVIVLSGEQFETYEVLHTLITCVSTN